LASLKRCIEMKCKDCSYDPMDVGTWRDQVERCVVRSCPLWEVRPMTVSTINLNRKTRAVEGRINIDALVAGLGEEDEPVAMAA